MKKKILLVLLTLLGGTGAALAQQSRVIQGQVRNAQTQSAVEYASAVLLRQDSSVVRGTTTDSAGAFTLVAPDKGRYLLRVSYVGYTTAFTPIDITAASPDTIRLGEIKLQSTDNTLRTATVTGVAARVEQKEDTTMFNASAYRVPEGSSLEALVKQLPGVEVSDDGKITWNGKEVKELLVNG